MLEALIRKEDILTRYGDEEFILVLPNTSEEQAFIFAERFRRDIEKMEFIPASEEERAPDYNFRRDFCISFLRKCRRKLKHHYKIR